MRTPATIGTAILSVFLCAGCGDSQSDPPSALVDASTASDAGAGGDAADAGPVSVSDAGIDIPLGSQAEIEAWLKAGAYKDWACEASPHASRPGSGHSANRICSNGKLSEDTGSGAYAVGAAGVKELFDSGGNINGYAIYAKVKPAEGGDTWFWYERIGSSIIANGVGVSLCMGCHAGAPRDHVFTQVKAAR